jgi:hypothetical protein
MMMLSEPFAASRRSECWAPDQDRCICAHRPCRRREPLPDSGRTAFGGTGEVSAEKWRGDSRFPRFSKSRSASRHKPQSGSMNLQEAHSADDRQVCHQAFGTTRIRTCTAADSRSLTIIVMRVDGPDEIKVLGLRRADRRRGSPGEVHLRQENGRRTDAPIRRRFSAMDSGLLLGKYEWSVTRTGPICRA